MDPSRGGDGMGDQRVFVGGISWKVDEAMLKSFFETTYGPVVECKLIMDKQTGNSKGYGFVTFVSPETAAQVKQQGSIPFMGKNMNVGDAYRKEPAATRPAYGGGGGMPGGRMPYQPPPMPMGMPPQGRPGGGLLEHPQSYGHHAMAPPPSHAAYPPSMPPQGGQAWGHSAYPQGGGYYDPYQNTGRYYPQWPAQQAPAQPHPGQQAYGYTPQQPQYDAYSGYQQPGAQQPQQPPSYGYAQPQQPQQPQQATWPQQQLLHSQQPQQHYGVHAQQQ